MKMIVILLTIACLQVNAAGYAQKLSLSLKDRPLVEVLKEIKVKTGYKFFYKLDLLNNAKNVSIRIDNADLPYVLDIIFKDQPFTYQIVNKTIIVTARQHADIKVEAAVLNMTVSGRVTDEKGNPLPGVSVQVKGTSKGAQTNANGEYQLTGIDENAILIFSYLGYQPKELPVNGRNSIAVTLTSSSIGLGDVVVVGYGKQSRKSLISAVNTVKAEDLNKGAITDVGQLLQGKVPGLNISASGDPNAVATVVLRGASTLNSSQGPFYVIDGVPGVDISAIAPDDVASIDVLKDAAATAIYGNRAANGVIMVTTKKGKKGQTQVSYSGYVGIEKVSNKLDMMDAGELRNFLTKNGQSFSPADDKSANTNWQSSIQRNQAISHNHNISFSGGGDHGTYAASLNYTKKEGILLNSDLERVIARLSVEQYALNDKVRFGLNVTNSNSNANDIPYRNVVLLQSALHLPVSPIKNADGSYFENFTSQGYYNPLSMINNSQMNDKYNNLVGSFNTQVKLPFGLTYDLNLSYIGFTSMHGEFYNKYFTTNYNSMYDNPNPGLGFHNPQTFGANGQATRNSYQNTSKILETFLTWNRNFKLHAVNLVLGYSWQNNKVGEGFQVTTSNFPVDNIGYTNLALSNPYAVSGFQIGFGPDGVYQENRLISNFARLNYGYNEKYLLQASLRRDGSSVFGENHQWGYFPSVGVAWRIIQEEFMKNQAVFTDLKLRASYGVTGNATGFNAYTARFISGTQGVYYYNGSAIAASGPIQAANPNLQWEKTSTANIGVDFTVLKGKLSGSVDVYNKKTTGMIYSYKVDPILVPAGTIVANGGSMSNKGIELSLNATVIDNKNFSWTSSINLAHNKNEITSLSNPLFSGGDSILLAFPEGLGQSSHSLEILKEGKPLGQFFSLIYAGKDANGVSQYIGGDGKLTTTPAIGTDYHYIGNSQPKLLMGWSNSFHYKNFDLSIFLRGVFGNKIFNATRADLFRPNTAQYTNILKDAAGESVADYNAYLYSSRFVESGSYVRFDNATLAYNFKNLGPYIKNVRVYATANNLFVITSFKGTDPEVNQGGIAPGVDYNNFYPKTRTFLFGVNVSF
ncbi:TonB-dependent receptor [Chitinophaga sp. CF118]|uniref:TonB-dependent receptor n=1 Tax=Chitinophaga sp. CF118 TaxID=1884367 RepID=UPI000B7F1E61|nr:TonB-dependent receptor [Chitinophaga sp. CF118]